MEKMSKYQNKEFRIRKGPQENLLEAKIRSNFKIKRESRDLSHLDVNMEKIRPSSKTVSFVLNDRQNNSIFKGNYQEASKPDNFLVAIERHGDEFIIVPVLGQIQLHKQNPQNGDSETNIQLLEKSLRIKSAKIQGDKSTASGSAAVSANNNAKPGEDVNDDVYEEDLGNKARKKFKGNDSDGSRYGEEDGDDKYFFDDVKEKHQLEDEENQIKKKEVPKRDEKSINLPITSMTLSSQGTDTQFSRLTSGDDNLDSDDDDDFDK